MTDASSPEPRPTDLRARWKAVAQAHRRAVIAAGIVGVVTCSFAAGALATRGGGDTSRVEVENVGNAADETTTTAAATTTEAPTTTTTVAPTTTTEAPTTTAPPITTPPTTKPKPVAAPTYTFEAPGAGTMTVKLENGVLSIAGTHANEGWTAEIHTATGTEYVKTMFRHESTVKWVKARLKNGVVTPEIGEWTECDTTPDPSTAVYELGGVGALTVTWNGSAFTLDAVTPFDGWTVSDQEASGEYVRVFFAPASAEPAVANDGKHDGTKWIKVKIDNCQIVQFTGP